MWEGTQNGNEFGWRTMPTIWEGNPGMIASNKRRDVPRSWDVEWQRVPFPLGNPTFIRTTRKSIGGGLVFFPSFTLLQQRRGLGSLVDKEQSED